MILCKTNPLKCYNGHHITTAVLDGICYLFLLLFIIFNTNSKIIIIIKLQNLFSPLNILYCHTVMYQRIKVMSKCCYIDAYKKMGFLKAIHLLQKKEKTKNKQNLMRTGKIVNENKIIHDRNEEVYKVNILKKL